MGVNVSKKGSTVGPAGAENPEHAAKIKAAQEGRGQMSGADPKRLDLEQTKEHGYTALHVACQNGQKKLIKALIAKGASLNAQTSSGSTPLMLLISNGHVKTAIAVLAGMKVDTDEDEDHVDTNRLDVNIKTNGTAADNAGGGNDALRYACETGNEKLVDALIKKGAKVDAQDDRGDTSLMIAIARGFFKMATIILEQYKNQNLNLDVANKEGKTALRLACRHADENMVKALITLGARVDFPSVDGQTHLMGTIILLGEEQQKPKQNLRLLDGYENIAKMLLDHMKNNNLDVNQAATATSGNTALHFAAMYGQRKLVDILLKQGANVNMQSNSGETALTLAISKRYDGDLPMLFLGLGSGKSGEGEGEGGSDNNNSSQPADLKLATTDGYTALHFASIAGKKKIVKVLIEKGVDVEAKSVDGETPLMLSIANGHAKVASVLLEHITEVNDSDVNGYTALIYALSKGFHDLICALLAMGADVTLGDKKGNTPLIHASLKATDDVVDMLLVHGAGPNSKNGKGKTALMYACELGREKIVQKLLNRVDLDINACDDRGRTALIYIFYKGLPNIAKMMLQNTHIQINAQDRDGKTALMYYCGNGCMQIVPLLLEHEDIDTSITDSDDKTALMYACQNGTVSVVNDLIQHGADIHAVDWDGATAFAYALRKGNQMVMNALLGKAIGLNTPVADEKVSADECAACAGTTCRACVGILKLVQTVSDITG